MLDKQILYTKIPEPIKVLLRPIRNVFADKQQSELSFWIGVLAENKGVFPNSDYPRLMLAMAEEADDSFLEGKVVADFGCGPRGSLAWTEKPKIRIGIDILTDRYADEFTKNIISHGMVYLKSTEKVIPLPSNFVDVMFTLNAMDHVDSFSSMCHEILRVLKPGGDFIGSFNLEEPPTPTEPQRLTEHLINERLLSGMDIVSYRITEQRPGEIPYEAFFSGNLSYTKGKKGYLWVRGKKRIDNST